MAGQDLHGDTDCDIAACLSLPRRTTPPHVSLSITDRRTMA